MTTKRKAELQRKLALSPVANPPAGLSEKIKRDIPHDFAGDTRADRERLSGGIGFNLRVAASVLLMISSAYVVLQLLPGTDRPLARKSTVAASTGVASRPAPASEVKASPLRDENSAGHVSPPAQAAPVMAAESSSSVKTPVAKESSEQRADGDQQYAPEIPPPAAPSPALIAATAEVADNSAAGVSHSSAAPEQESALAHAGNAADERQEPAMRSGSLARGVAGQISAAAAPMGKTQKSESKKVGEASSLFGIHIDGNLFEQVRTTIGRGQQPVLSQMDVEALINYFAGAPRANVRSVILDAELSPPIAHSSPRHRLIRLTIDTPAPGTDGTAAPGVAALSVIFDSRTVAAHRRIGGPTRSFSTESSLPYGSSVTGLFDIELKPAVKSWQRIATIQLSYHDADGSARSIERVLLSRNTAASWVASSPRHRLASLGAMWGEALRSNTDGAEVAKRAKELAQEQPGDSRAGELARVTAASFRLQNSGPTGSER